MSPGSEYRNTGASTGDSFYVLMLVWLLPATWLGFAAGAVGNWKDVEHKTLTTFIEAALHGWTWPTRMLAVVFGLLVWLALTVMLAMPAYVRARRERFVRNLRANRKFRQYLRRDLRVEPLRVLRWAKWLMRLARRLGWLLARLAFRHGASGLREVRRLAKCRVRQARTRTARAMRTMRAAGQRLLHWHPGAAWRAWRAWPHQDPVGEPLSPADSPLVLGSDAIRPSEDPFGHLELVSAGKEV